jgi:hypothetical protein
MICLRSHTRTHITSSLFTLSSTLSALPTTPVQPPQMNKYTLLKVKNFDKYFSQKRS